MEEKLCFKIIALLKETTNCNEDLDGGTNVSCQLTLPDPVPRATPLDPPLVKILSFLSSVVS